MRLPIPAGRRRRTRRALLAAALPAVLAAVALPPAPQAAEVSGGQGAVSVLDRSFFGGATESNDVTVSVEGSFLAVTDSAGISTAQQGSGGTCFRFSSVEARCPLSISNVSVHLAGGHNVENVIGGAAGDRLHSLGVFSRLEGPGGADTLTGDGGPDTLIGGPGIDRLQGGTENDVIDSLDGEAENVDCGPGDDTLLRDFDGFVSCENIKIGVLRLAPKTIAANAGKAAHMRLSWRHPESWRELRTIELRLTQDGTPVGEVTVRPRAQRVTADGAVKLARRHTRLTRKGKTVTARLAVRLHESLAGQTLTAEVEATDARGRRQLERDAGRIRVSG